MNLVIQLNFVCSSSKAALGCEQCPILQSTFSATDGSDSQKSYPKMIQKTVSNEDETTALCSIGKEYWDMSGVFSSCCIKIKRLREHWEWWEFKQVKAEFKRRIVTI